MKMTLEIDPGILSRVMELTGIRTKTAAVEFALRSVERLTLKKKLLDSPLDPDELSGAVDSDYDLMALRGLEIPGRQYRPRGSKRRVSR